MPFAIEINTSQDLLITVAPVDASGAPSMVQTGTLAAISINPDVLGDGSLVNPADYGVSGVGDEGLLCRTTGTIGAFELTISADADPGDGVVTISDVVTGTVSHTFASSLGLGAVGVPKK